MSQIEDGRGTGYRVRINEENAMIIRGTTQTEEHYICSFSGDSYFLNTATTANTLTGTATGGPLLYVKNEHPTKQLVIAKLDFGSDTAGILFWLTGQPTLGTIGNNNIVIPPTMLIGATNTPQGIFYSWNEVGDGMTGLSGGSKMNVFVAAVGQTDIPVDGSIILESGAALTFNYAGAGEISAGIRFFYMDPET